MSTSDHAPSYPAGVASDHGDFALKSQNAPLPEMIVGGMFGGTPLKGKLKTKPRLLGGSVHGGGVEQCAPEVGAGEIGALEVGAF